jgi:membrane protease YdiL (CAAX protease family)
MDPSNLERYSPNYRDPPTGIIEPALLPEVVPVPPRGHPVLAWGVILAFVLFSVGLPYLAASIRPSERLRAARENPSHSLDDMQYRYFIGAGKVLQELGQDPSAQLKDLDRDPIESRLRFIILTAELKSPQNALAELQNRKRDGLLRDPAHAELVTALQQALRDPTELTDEQREQLRRDLGWMGELVQHPPSSGDPTTREALLSSARQTFIGIIVVALVGLLCGLLGMALLVLVLTAAWRGWLSSGLRLPSGTGAVYAETFALWLLLFMFAQIGAAMAGWLLTGGKSMPLGLLGLGTLASLVALGWPVLRGVPWGQVRRELGLTLGTRPFGEILIGIGTYIMALPLLVVGVFMTLGIMKLQTMLRGSEAPMPSHPVSEILGNLGPWGLVQALFVLSVAAPLVEEAMFRGVLYRHLREATMSLRPGVSMVLSASVVSLIFAAVHPQGIAAIPPLMALAFSFTLAREWRGSLLAPMVAHGLNNGLVLLASVLLLQG